MAHSVSFSAPWYLNIEKQRRDVIVVGASAGGIPALRELLTQLPASLPAVIAVVVHLSRTYESLLPQQLARATQLTVIPASESAELQPGHVYVGVPDRHLVFRDHHIALTRDATEHLHRPAVNQLFQSAANVYGPRVVGVVLSGAGFDGVLGAIAIKAAGGIVAAQDPSEAIHSSMPRAAIGRGVVDVVLPVVQLAATLQKLAAGETVDRASPE